MSWAVVILKPNQSKRAEENLSNQGFTTFFPKIAFSSLGKLITKDLFPGYGFIKFNKSKKLVSINSTRGISRVMHFNNSVPQLSDSIIENIRTQLNNINSQLVISTPFKRSDRVIINLKILSNQEAEVIDISNKKDNQKALLKIINSAQTVWVDIKDLEPVPV
jgi:transcription antitermination factor NusG